MRNKLIAMLLTVTLLAMALSSAMAAAPKVKGTGYEGNGVVEVEFRTENVRYKCVKVVVKNAAGKALPVKILELDDDEITFKVSGFKAGAKYCYTVSGVRAGKSGSYGSVRGCFRVPAKPMIKKAAYDRKDREIEVDFAAKVQYKNLEVTVKDAKGNAVKVKGLEKDDDDLDVKVPDLIAGEKYTVTVKGVRAKGQGSYITLRKTFVA